VIVRSSFLAEMKLCFARAHYAYDLGLVLKGGGKNPDLLFGTAIHKAIEKFHKEGKEEALAFLQDMEFPQHGVKNRINAITLLNMYVASKPPKLLVAEKDFTFKIGRHEWRGRFDGIAKVNGELYVVEHKTTKPYYLQFKPNDQFISYWAGAKVYFSEVAGILINSLDPHRLEVNRYLITFTLDELKRWRQETKLLLSFYTLCTTKGVFPKSPFACKAFGRDCPYTPLCKADPSQKQLIIDRCYNISREQKELDW